LRSWGFGSWFQGDLTLDDLLPDGTPSVGRVVSAARRSLTLVTALGIRPAVPAGSLEDFAVVGDWCVLRPDTLTTPGSPALATRVLRRKTAFIRRDPDRRRDQVLAANADELWIAVPLHVEPNSRRIERTLALAAESGAEPVIVLTKTDLVADLAPALARARAAAPGVEVVAVSALAGDLDPLRARLTPALTVAITGPSGAGKSSIINGLLGEDLLPTGEVRARDGRGRHVTTTRKLLQVPGGALLLDTPGLRSLGLTSGATPDSAFPEIAALAAECRFRDCGHGVEPGCAIRTALADGTLDADRWAAFNKLQRELAYETRRGDALAEAAERRRWKAIHTQAAARERFRNRNER
jgi:ribosome biogenesis GTPase